MSNRKGTIAAFALAAVLIGLGLAQGQQSDVLSKAVRICLECVGVG